MSELAYHRLAELFPLLEGEEYDQLCDDIEEHGLREPIVICDGDILDGRNRYRACVARKVEPQFRELPESIDPFDFVVSANLHRRHLTPAQRREVVDAVLKQMPEKSNREIARKTGVSHPTVASAREDLESTGKIYQLNKTTGKDGKKRPAKKMRPVAPAREELEHGGEIPHHQESTAEIRQLQETDENGFPIPDHVLKYFGETNNLKEFGRLIDQAIRVLKDDLVLLHRHLHVGPIVAQLKKCKSAAMASKPTHVCVYCRAKNKDCQACGGEGWLNKSMYEAAPPEKKKEARAE
jgi:hypothetical protein